MVVVAESGAVLDSVVGCWVEFSEVGVDSFVVDVEEDDSSRGIPGGGTLGIGDQSVGAGAESSVRF